MSHSPTVFTPAGTPLPSRTVGELVAERPGRSRIFQEFGIDFCCQGSRTLAEACERKSVAIETMVALIEAEQADKGEPAENPGELGTVELADYIVDRHHGYLRRELPRLHAMSHRVAQVHGGHTPSLIEVFEVFLTLENELLSHLLKEEQVLFPTISGIIRGDRQPVSLEGPIDCMVHEHEDAGAALARLRELTHGFNPPAEACNTYRALFAGLADLEKDLHTHIHLENSVLFPRAQALFNN